MGTRSAVFVLRSSTFPLPRCAVTATPARRFVSCSATPCRSTRPTLAALYPTHEDYVTKFSKATDAAVKAGFILAADAKNLKAAAASSTISAP